MALFGMVTHVNDAVIKYLLSSVDSSKNTHIFSNSQVVSIDVDYYYDDGHESH